MAETTYYIPENYKEKAFRIKSSTLVCNARKLFRAWFSNWQSLRPPELRNQNAALGFFIDHYKDLHAS
jgi:hypothetical protein